MPHAPSTSSVSAPREIRTDRRTMVLGGSAIVAGLVGGGSLIRMSLAQESTPNATSDTAVASPAASTINATVISDVVATANAFITTLSADEKAAVLFDWSDSEQKARWSNFPEGLFQRAGLMWGNLSEETQNAWLALMKATLSDRGYQRVREEWAADDALTQSAGSTMGGSTTASGTPAAGSGGAPTMNGTPPAGGNGGPGGMTGTPPAGGNGGPGGGSGGGGGMNYGQQYYWIAIIGTPSETDPWQWQWGGHHVTVNATIGGGNIALTPSFIGVQPATYTDDAGNEVRPLGDISDDAFALVNALPAEQQSAAILGDTYIDLVLGPGEDGKTLQPEGLLVSDMNAENQTAITQLISLYTGLIDERMAAARLAEVTSVLDQTYFAWYGPTESGSSSYFRVAGPTIVIEFSPQGGMSASAADHIHGIYRDPSNDYGAKYLA